MTITDIHAEVATQLAEFHRLYDPLQKRWRFTLCRPHIPVLVAERDTVAARIATTIARLEAFDTDDRLAKLDRQRDWLDANPTDPLYVARQAKHQETLAEHERSENDWIDGLHKLEELYDRHRATVAALDSIGQMPMKPATRTR